MQKQLIIFVKAPRLGAVKTRLARQIGVLRAWRFYRDNGRRLIRRLDGLPGVRLTLAVAPDNLAGGGGFWPAHLPILPQGPGDIGARMDRVLRRVPAGPAVLIGGDIPSIQARHLDRAFGLLRHHEAVFGPARDGGFWLVGFRRRPYPLRPFQGVHWSTSTALSDCLNNLPAHWRIAFVETLRDVDEAADWQYYRQAGRCGVDDRDR